MKSELKKVPIESLCIGIYDGPHATPPKSDSGAVFLGISNFSNGRLDLSNIRYISEDDLPKWTKRVTPKAHDIVFSYEATLNLYAIIPEGFYGCLGRRMALIRPDESKVDYRFLYYYMYSSQWREEIERHKVNGSTVDRIPLVSFPSFTVNLPSMATQKYIAEILSVLDEKIELNNKINDNLEQQARAYFQELFVDNSDPAWTLGTVSDLGAVVGGSTPSKSKPEYYTEDGVAWITPKDLSINKAKFISHGENDITELGLQNSSASIMPEGTVLFSSRAPIGYIAIASGEVTTNQGFKSVVPKPEIGTAYVYYFLKHNLPVIEGMASGSTFKEVSGSTMKNVPAVIPDTETLACFNDFCAPIFAQQRILEEQNQSLAALRDSLLPKLMSGELDVSGIQL